MSTWIAHKAATAPVSLEAVQSQLRDMDRLHALRDDSGGIRRDAVIKELMPRFARAGLVESSDSYLDFVDVAHGIAARVEGGRAHTNNDGLLAVLEGARDPSARTVLLVVPRTYKGSACADPMTGRLSRLLGGPGIDLDLDGVAVVAY